MDGFLERWYKSEFSSFDSCDKVLQKTYRNSKRLYATYMSLHGNDMEGNGQGGNMK